MNRREFISSGAAAAAISTTGGPNALHAATTPRKVLMKIGATASLGGGGGEDGPGGGGPNGGRGAGAASGAGGGRGRGAGGRGAAGGVPQDPEAGFKALGRWGIKNVTASAPIADSERIYATVDELKRLTDAAAKYQISVDVLNPPFLPSSNINSERHPAIMLGESPQRDRDIEQIQTMIKNCAAANIPCIKYNLSLLGVVRMGKEDGRGDTSYTAYDWSKRNMNAPLTKAGVVSAEQNWERITYFLKNVIPVATEYKVRMALHPNDGPVPPEGYMGVQCVLNTVEGLKRFVAINESPYHGLNFCQGTTSEMLQDPGKEIYDVIRYFGSRKKIFNVHFRNILGNRQKFDEVAPDEGSVNMFKAILAYKEVDYPYMIQPDHNVSSPSAQGDDYTTYVYGYIRALLQAAELV
jgi:mannonate dehydratase